jgi:hypothetical protein
VERIVRHVLDTRVDLLAIMMAELGLPEEVARRRLTALVHALRFPRIEETIFEGGRRMATAVEEGDPPVIRLNEELLQRVGDDEVLTALARPIADITELASVGVSLAFQVEDEQALRNMTTRAHRRSDEPSVRATEIDEWVGFRIETMADRVQRMCGHLGRASVVESDGEEELLHAVRGAHAWPEWVDISDQTWCRNAVESIGKALEDTPHGDAAAVLAELLWDSLALSPQSFLRHAGRSLRGRGGDLSHIGELLRALAAAVSGESEFSTDVADWGAYADVSDAWENLNRHEKAMFGPVLLRDRTPSASVVEPARFAFGLDEPAELPWDLPLLCWTVREQNALRDLLVGFVKTLPGHTEEALEGQADLHLESEPPLEASPEPRTVGIQVIALNADAALSPPASFSRAWSSGLHRLLDQFMGLSFGDQAAVNVTLRNAYDELFPASRPIWARRFYDLDHKSELDAFKQLATTPNEVFRTPVFFDPFHNPEADELAPYPTLVFPVGINGPGKVPFFVPVVALTSTMNGSPLRVRIVEVPAGTGGTCHWVCDRGLHLAKLSKQAVELILRAVRGDSLQMAVFES